MRCISIIIIIIIFIIIYLFFIFLNTIIIIIIITPWKSAIYRTYLIHGSASVGNMFPTDAYCIGRERTPAIYRLYALVSSLRDS